MLPNVHSVDIAHNCAHDRRGSIAYGRGVIDAFRAALAARDLTALMELTTPDVTLKSPIMGGRFVLEGRAEVAQAYRVLFEDFATVELGDTFAGPHGHVLMFSGLARGERFDAVHETRLAADGRIAEVVLYVRPFVGLAAFARVVGPGFMRPHRRTWAWIASAYGAFVVVAVRILAWLGAPMVKTSVRRLAARQRDA